jgi:uncharacterized protein YlbG (UPF0298 family)
MKRLFESWRSYLKESQDIWTAEEIVGAMGFDPASAPSHIKIAADMLFDCQRNPSRNYLIMNQVIDEYAIGSMDPVILNKEFAKEFKELYNLVEESIKDLDLSANPNYDVLYYSAKVIEDLMNEDEDVDFVHSISKNVISSQDEKYTLINYVFEPSVVVDFSEKKYKSLYSFYNNIIKNEIFAGVDQRKATEKGVIHFLRVHLPDIYFEYARLYIDKEELAKTPENKTKLSNIEKDLKVVEEQVSEIMAYYNGIPILI